MATPIKMGPIRSLDEARATPPPKTRVSFVSRFARWLERDMALRLISLTLAIGLWIFVNAGQHGALESFQVPVSYRDLPPGFIPIPNSSRFKSPDRARCSRSSTPRA
jgi:hypothetical protein